MNPTPPTAHYETPPTPHRRSIGTWAVLLIVWSIGLVFWSLYAIAAFYLVSRVI